MEQEIEVSFDSGLFSCCTVMLNRIILHYNEYNNFPIVNSSNLFNVYKDFDVDITNQLFNYKNNEIITECDYINFNKINIPDFTYHGQFSDYKNINYKNINPIIKKYFTPIDYIQKIKKYLISKYDLNLDKTISVYFRGNDKSIETNIPNYNEFIQKIESLVQLNPNHTLLVQTDENEFFQCIKDKYPNSIFFEEMPGIDKNLHTIPALTVEKNQRLFFAQLFLSIVLIMSQTNIVILNSGNVGMWISLYRGNGNNIFQFLDNKEFIYGHKNITYGIENTNWLH